VAHPHDPLRPHSHDPNPAPPSASPDFVLALPDGSRSAISPDDLRSLPQTTVPECYIVSTGHGASGPFAFTGVTLADFVGNRWPGDWQQVEVISSDGFGTRLSAEEIRAATQRPILLAHAIDGQPLSRAAGLVRLIVPSETDDALKQVKWIGRVNILNAEAGRRREDQMKAILHENEISGAIVDAAIEVHRTFGGPGLLERVYQQALVWELESRGFTIEQEKFIPVVYKGRTAADPLRLDLLVEQRVIVECKALTQYNSIFEAQLLTYLRLTNLKLGLVINFGAHRVKDGVYRVVNGL